MSSTRSLRTFIRECAKINTKKDLYEGYLDLFTPTMGTSGYPQPSFIQQVYDGLKSPIASGTTSEINFVGMPFSTTKGGPAKFIVVATKKGKTTVVLSHKDATQADFKTSAFRPVVLNAEKIDMVDKFEYVYSDDPVVEDMQKNMSTWSIEDATGNSDLYTAFSTSYGRSSSTPGKPVRNTINTAQVYYVVDDLSNAIKDGKIFYPEDLYNPENQQRALKFECVLSFDEAWKYVNEEDPRTANFLLGAACFYKYASSMWAPLAAGVIGAALGAMIAAPTGETAGVVSIPVLSAGAAMAGADLFFRWPVLRWAVYNDKIDFAISNAIYLCLSFIPLSAGGYVGKTFAGKAIARAMEKPIKFMVTQIIISMAFDAGKPIDEARLNQQIESLYNDEDQVNQNLSSSEAELVSLIKKKYSFKEQLP